MGGGRRIDIISKCRRTVCPRIGGQPRRRRCRSSRRLTIRQHADIGAVVDVDAVNQRLAAASVFGGGSIGKNRNVGLLALIDCSRRTIVFGMDVGIADVEDVFFVGFALVPPVLFFDVAIG